MKKLNGKIEAYVRKVSSSGGMQDTLLLGGNGDFDLYVEVSGIDSVGFDYYSFKVDRDGFSEQLKAGFCEHESAQELESSLNELLA